MSNVGLSIGITSQRSLFFDLFWKGFIYSWEARRFWRVRRRNPVRQWPIVFSGRDVRRAALYRR